MSSLANGFTGVRHAPIGHAHSLVIILHGVGSTATAMAPLFSAIVQGLPDAAVIAAEGLQRFDMGSVGRQWFSVRGVTEANRRERVENCLPSICALVEEERLRVGVAPEQVALVGFSQGAIIALHIAATAQPPGAIVAFAGRLATPITVENGRRPPMLLSHGELDAVIPAKEAVVAAQAFARAGFPVQTRIVPGLGHRVDSKQIVEMVEFLQTSLKLQQTASDA